MREKVINCLVAAILVVTYATCGWASNTDDVLRLRAPRSAAVTPGVWHADLAKAKAYAEQHGLPLVAVWSNGDFCSHCLQFEGAIASKVFQDAMKASGMVFYFGAVNDGSYNYNGGTGPSADGQEGYHGTAFYWCCRNQNHTTNWPYVRFYWPKGGVDVVYDGATVDGEGLLFSAFPCTIDDPVPDPENFYYPGDYDTYNPAGRYAINFIANKSTGVFRNFTPVPPYDGGEFAMLDAVTTPTAGLQLERGVNRADFIVPLSRTNTAVRAAAGTNYLVVKYPNGTAWTNKIDWAANEGSREVKVPLSAATTSSKATNFQLQLFDKDGKVKETSRVAIVEKIANSSRNPLAVGERTSATLKAGEWTMDLPVALAAAKAAKAKGGDTYTLCVVAGTLWCPDCEKVETYLLDSAAFKTWATTTHQVACALVDVAPTWREKPADRIKPTLTSYTVATGVTGKPTSGAGWMSRHNVAYADATKVTTRNTGYVTKTTANGGLLLPGKTTWTHGVPCLILYRADGTVIGRLPMFSKSANTANLTESSAASFVKRLEELVSLAPETEEENNGVLSATKAKVSARNKVGKKGSLSFGDQVDCYAIENAPRGTDATFTIKGTSAAKMTVSILDGTLADPDAAPVATQTAKLSAGVTVRGTLPSDSCYVKVSYPVTSAGVGSEAQFAFTQAGSTVVSYTLTSDSVLTANELMPKVPTEITDGINEITILLEKGVKYKFVGVDVADNAFALAYDTATETFTSLTSGAVKLTLKPTGGKLLFAAQQWKPGSVSFAVPQWTVKERGDASTDDLIYDIVLKRQGGVSGTASVKVNFLPGESRYVQKDPTFEYLGADTVVTWEEGDAEDKSVSVKVKANTYADGPQQLAFAIVAEKGCAASVDAKARFVLTVTDDDYANPGVLALTAVDGQPIPDSRIVQSLPGKTLNLTVAREVGSDGLLAAEILLDGKSVGTVEWQGRDGEDKTLDVKLPTTVSGGQVELVLAGVDGSKIVYEKKFLTIKVGSVSGPVFDEEQVERALTRYVALGSPIVVAVKGTATGLSVAKVTGSVAPGLSWGYDEAKHALVIDGVPTVAGSYQAIFQAVKGSTKGGAVMVALTVSDPVALDEKGVSKNKALANTRTIADAIVVDEARKCLAGLLTVTVPRSGRVSAKFRPVGGETVSFLSEGWDSEKSGSYATKLAVVSEAGAGVYALTVEARASGTIALTLKENGKSLTVKVPTSTWTASTGKTYAGLYTVSLPHFDTLSGTPMATGAATLSLQMTDATAIASGRMTYAGLLPNGKAISGSVVLGRDGSDALLTAMSESSTDTFAGVLRLNVKDHYRKVFPCSDVYPLWAHHESAAPSSEVLLDAFGCLYDEKADLVACCETTFQTQTLKLFAVTDLMTSVAGCTFGKATAWDAAKAGIRVSKSGDHCDLTLVNPSQALSALGLSFSYARESGLVSGTVSLKDANGKTLTGVYRGVVMPGWGTASCTSCTDGSQEALKSPFVSGSCWFTDTYTYKDAKGRTRTVAVKRGCPISIGLNPGE